MANAGLDENSRQTLTALSNAGNGAIVPLWADPVTHRLLTSAVATANLIIGTSTITSGTTGLLLYDNAGVVGELPTATYPSLTELSYVKGVTSGIQSQLNGKQATLSLGTGVATALAINIGTAGAVALNNVATLSSLTSANGSTIPASDTLVGRATTDTLTNKRVTPRVLSATTYTTDTGTSINGDTQDMFIVTAQAGALKFNNPTGTPTDGQKLIISVASSTTSARALTWDTAYGATTVALPSTTTATTATLTMGFIYSTSKSLWQIVAVA